MEIRLLKSGYKNNEQLYRDFINGTIDYNQDYFSDETVITHDIPNFPIYIAKGSEEEKQSKFLEAIKTLKTYFITTDRDIHLNERFWHSFLVTKKRDFIINEYPVVTDGIKEFNNIVLKKFDWENYIYKCALAAEYIEDAKFSSEAQEEKYMKLIYENLDLYNYIIKYSIFRNSEFIIKLLTVIDEENLSSQLKAQIKSRPDLGADERYGRRVIYELNKNYPVIMSPFLDKDELKEEIYSALALYQ